jgi:hypothetical protein
MNNDYFELAQDLFSKKDYDKAFSELDKCVSEKVVSFIYNKECFNKRKKSHKGNCIKPFWKSQIPAMHLNSITKSQLKEDFLLSFFSSEEYFSETILQNLLKTQPKITINFFKLTKAFEKEIFLKCLFSLKNDGNSQIRNFVKEIEFIFKLSNDWEEKRKYFDVVIDETSYEDILIQTISYFEKFKRSSSEVRNNNDLLISREVNLCYVLNNILEIKKKYYEDNNLQIHKKYKTVDEFYNVLKQELPPINSIEGITKQIYIPKEEISPKKQLLRDCIEFYFAKFQFDMRIDAYCCGFLDFQLIDSLDAEMITNNLDKYRRRNDQKNRFPERLALSKVQVSNFPFGIDPMEKEVQLSFEVFKNYFNYLKIALIAKTKDNIEIDLERIFLILQSLSLFLMPEGRYFINDGGSRVIETTRDKPKEFNNLFMDNYICVFDERTLVNGILTYFGWTEVEVRLLIDYLTLDLKTQYEINFFFRPLIKIDNHYFWLSSLLKKRNWPGLLLNRLAISNSLNHKAQSSEIEKAVSEEFSRIANSTNSYCYNIGCDDEGEIDVLVFWENHLLVIEIKTTYNTEDLIRNAIHYSKQVTNKANFQLNRALDFINSEKGFKRIKEIDELKIPADTELSQIKVIPLIVSNIFNYDDAITSDNYLKFSMFELMIILKNDLYNLLHINTNQIMQQVFGVSNSKLPDLPTHFISSFGNGNNQFIKKQQQFIDKEECDLWDGSKLHVKDFLSAIEKDKVWKFLDDINIFPDMECKMELFDVNRKWLC